MQFDMYLVNRITGERQGPITFELGEEVHFPVATEAQVWTGHMIFHEGELLHTQDFGRGTTHMFPGDRINIDTSGMSVQNLEPIPYPPPYAVESLKVDWAKEGF